jgi:hypothetical protein
MKTNTIQLMIYGDHLSDVSATSTSPGLGVRKVYRIDNPRYAFIDIVISPNARAGDHTVLLKNPSGTTRISYHLLRREPSDRRYQGFDRVTSSILLHRTGSPTAIRPTIRFPG